MLNSLVKNNETTDSTISNGDGNAVVVQNGSTANLEAALMAIGNAGFGNSPIRISVITLEINTNHN